MREDDSDSKVALQVQSRNRPVPFALEKTLDYKINGEGRRHEECVSINERNQGEDDDDAGKRASFISNKGQGCITNIAVELSVNICWKFCKVAGCNRVQNRARDDGRIAQQQKRLKVSGHFL